MVVILIAIGALAAMLASAQVPQVGEIELYGLRKLREASVRRALDVRPGDLLPPSRGDLEERLEGINGVVRARVEAVCCEEGKAVLFVGLEERGAPHFAFRSHPSGAAGLLPEEILKTYTELLAALEAAARRGSTAEDLTRGHSLMADPTARELQERFTGLAAEHLELLRKVLRESSDARERAVAAVVIGYAPDKKAVLDDLQLAMQDPDEAVRANAMRSLAAIAVLASLRPELDISIPPTWFVEMLNSLPLSDRTRAAAALVNLTERGDQAALEQIRARALPSVLEMARWKTLRYALPAFILAGRIAGLKQDEIEAAWTHNERENVLAKLEAP